MFRPDPKPLPKEKKQRKPLKRSAIKYRRKTTGERSIFIEIAKERGRRSEIKPHEYINPLLPGNFMHVLAKGKGKFPAFKLYKKNILIVTGEQHDQYDHGSQEKLRRDPNWNWVFELREELLQEYKQLHG